MNAGPSAELEDVIDEVTAVSLDDSPVSARSSWMIAHRVARGYGNDARLFLVLSADVNPSGLAPNWAFHYMFPALHAEGVLTVRTAQHSTTGRPEIHARVMPFPAPGTPESVMVGTGGAYMLNVVEQAWRSRLDRIAGLPLAFHDSTEAVAEMLAQGHVLSSGGPIRLKGRMKPDDVSVWETVTPNSVIHTSFGI